MYETVNSKRSRRRIFWLAWELSKLYCQLKLTDEEQSIIEKADLGWIGHEYYQYFDKHDTNYTTELSVLDLTSGIYCKISDIQVVRETEGTIIRGCEELKTMIQEVTSFHGEELLGI